MTIKNALIEAKSRLEKHENEALFILCEYLKKIGLGFFKSRSRI